MGHSAELLLTSRAWLTGFVMESGGFALYICALALAELPPSCLPPDRRPSRVSSAIWFLVNP
ncbi:MAG: hypothetical protein ACRDJX_10030 [Solirubrobacteraceae bacterium]